MPRRKKQVRLTDRDRLVLAMAAVGMVTPYFVQKGVLEGGSIDGARSLIRRLVGERPEFRYLRPEPLDGDRICYRLTNEGRRLAGASKEAAIPLKKQGRITRYAVTWFIFVDKPGHRQLFSLRDYPDLFDVRTVRLPRHPFFITQSEDEQTLGVILIDHNASPRRMLYKTEKALERILREGWFDDFLRSGRLSVSVLTFGEERKRLYESDLPRETIGRLRRPLSRVLSLPLTEDSVPFEFHVVPGLESIITGPPCLFDGQ